MQNGLLGKARIGTGRRGRNPTNGTRKRTESRAIPVETIRPKPYRRLRQICFNSRPRPSRSGKTTDSVTPASRSCCRIRLIEAGEMLIDTRLELFLPNRLLSHSGFVPKIMNRLRCAAIRRVTWGESKRIGMAGVSRSLSSKSSSSAGR
jgi:hypothetical protein